MSGPLEHKEESLLQHHHSRRAAAAPAGLLAVDYLLITDTHPRRRAEFRGLQP